MKHLVMAILVVTAAAEAVHSQNINWRSLDENQRNTVQLNLGYDYGVTSQLGYSRSFTIVRPLVVGVDFSVPMGSTLLDDFKVRIGGQVELVETGGFSDLTRLAPVPSDLLMCLGNSLVHVPQEEAVHGHGL